ncbi:MAG: energy transducer TonB [Chitinophagaceae bacterium]
MDTNKILSADILDLIFDDRNKEYGAYELRKTYHTRITKSLVFTGVFVTLIFTGVVLANKFTPGDIPEFFIRGEVTIAKIAPEEKETAPIPVPPERTEPIPVQRLRFTQIEIVADENVVEPPATIDDLRSAKIDLIKQAGGIDNALVKIQPFDNRKGLIEEKITREPEGPLEFVEIDAKFDGNWEKFLLRNLNAQTPVDNEAPAGNYKVLIQFVVDIDGTVNDFRPLTNLGYGLEQEAIRVLKKAKNWEPAIQNGRQVKAYRIQAITFQVTSEE